MWFDPQTVATGWFDPQAKSRGWFDRDLIENSSAPLNDIAGNSSIAFTLSSSLSGLSSLTSTTTLLFALSSTLTGRSFLSANAAAVFSPSATLTGFGSVMAVSFITFLPTASLNGDAVLSGAANLILNLIGSLSGAQSNDIFGTSEIAFVLSGEVTSFSRQFVITNDQTLGQIAILPSSLPDSVIINVIPPPAIWVIS